MKFFALLGLLYVAYTADTQNPDGNCDNSADQNKPHQHRPHRQSANWPKVGQVNGRHNHNHNKDNDNDDGKPEGRKHLWGRLNGAKTGGPRKNWQDKKLEAHKPGNDDSSCDGDAKPDA